MMEKTMTDVHDVHVVNDLLSLRFTTEQLAAFGPPPDNLPGFLTFFDPGWDILRLRTHCKDKGRIFHQPNSYCDREEFGKKQEQPRYRQIRMEAVEGSFNRIFSQKAPPPDTEEIPLMRQVVMGTVVHFLLTEQRLFGTYYVRCIDKDRGGNYVALYWHDGLLCMDSDWNFRREGLEWVSTARKF